MLVVKEETAEVGTDVVSAARELAREEDGEVERGRVRRRKRRRRQRRGGGAARCEGFAYDRHDLRETLGRERRGAHDDISDKMGRRMGMGWDTYRLRPPLLLFFGPMHARTDN